MALPGRRLEVVSGLKIPVLPKRKTSGKRVSFNKKIGVRTFETQVSDISEEKQPIESPDLSILTKKDTPSYVSFKTAEEYKHQEALEKSNVGDQRTAEKELNMLVKIFIFIFLYPIRWTESGSGSIRP